MLAPIRLSPQLRCFNFSDLSFVADELVQRAGTSLAQTMSSILKLPQMHDSKKRKALISKTTKRVFQ